ncbi:MAG: iron-sulfur cluster assembly scaffold protein [Verrucomicrobiota bacterium]
MSDFESKVQEALANPQNMGEMNDADAVGTVGSPDCGDMVRMWLKFSEKDGHKVIDRASFQSFGCQTAIAVASLATEMLKGKTVEEARDLESSELSEGLGPLPPMKIHCGQMVEGALKQALETDQPSPASQPESEQAPDTLLSNMNQPAQKTGKLKVVFKETSD